MWRGFTPALVLYGLICARTWTSRGHADTTEAQVDEFSPDMLDASQDDLRRAGLLPPWLGDEALHVSHRSKLLTKDPEHYQARFGGTPLGLDYVWPPPPAAPSTAPAGGPPLWVVRTDSAHVTGSFVADGVVALGTDSGIEVDVTGRELPDLQALAGSGRRRTSKPLLALARFVTDMQPGDEVGVFISRDQALLTGRITGGYVFDARAAHGLVHRREVSWQAVTPRSAVQPPASLQDVRPVFRVLRAMP